MRGRFAAAALLMFTVDLHGQVPVLWTVTALLR